MNDGVVLLHGIFCTRRQMRRLEKFLQKSGYRTLNLTYPSRHMPIENIAGAIRPAIEQFAGECEGRVHFVGFSMGGLVIRAFLNLFRPERLGRVVMLAPPNHGSEMADLVQRWWLYRKLYGPAGQQLVTQLKDAEQVFGSVNYELGVIAGNCSLDPLATRIIGGPNDGKVSVESTRLDGMKDHIVMRVWHTFFPVHRQSWRETLHFLKEGAFSAVTH